MVEWYLRVITIDHDEHTLTSHLPHLVRAKLVAKRGCFWILCLYLQVRRISRSVRSHKNLKKMAKEKTLINKLLDKIGLGRLFTIVTIVLICIYIYLAFFRDEEKLASHIMTLLQVLVTLVAFYFSITAIPFLREIKKSVVGRESYIKRALEIYNSSNEVRALIEGWDANDRYIKTLESGNIGNVKFMGPLEMYNKTILGAIARIAAFKIRQTTKPNTTNDQILIRHIPRSKCQFKFIVGDNSVLIGEEYGAGDVYHSSDSGVLLESQTEDKYLDVYRREFDSLWENGIPVEKEIINLSLIFYQQRNSQKKISSFDLLTGLTTQRCYNDFIEVNKYYGGTKIIEIFETILTESDYFTVKEHNVEIINPLNLNEQTEQLQESEETESTNNQNSNQND